MLPQPLRSRLSLLQGSAGPQYLKDTPEPNSGRIFNENFHTFDAVKGVWSFFNTPIELDNTIITCDSKLCTIGASYKITPDQNGFNWNEPIKKLIYW